MAEPPTFAFNQFDDAVKANPYPLYAEMRATGRVISNPFLAGQFMVPGYDDVIAMLNDPEVFSNGRLGSGMGDDVLGAKTMLNSDPPDHERLRGVVARAFTPKSITALIPRMEARAAELVAPLADGEESDIATGLAQQLPVLVIAELLGVSTGDLDDFIEWSHGLLGTLDVLAPPEKAETARQYGKQLREYFADEAARRRDRPTSDDLVGRLVAANTDGVLTDAEVLAACVLLLLGGNETTTKLITNAVLAFARHPDQQARVAAEESLVVTAVDEALRFDAPVQGNGRVATRDTELAGYEILNGSLVVGLLGAANHDPARFDAPERFDVGRDPNPALSFGRGIHHCLGANLARLEARAALAALFRVAPRFTMVTKDEDLRYGATFFFHSPEELVITR